MFVDPQLPGTHTHPLPHIAALPLLKPPWQVQICFFLHAAQAAASLLGITVEVICVFGKK